MKSRDKRKVDALWNSLTTTERWELGDALVLGTFDWRDYFTEKPTNTMMKMLDEKREFWEQTQE